MPPSRGRGSLHPGVQNPVDETTRNGAHVGEGPPEPTRVSAVCSGPAPGNYAGTYFKSSSPDCWIGRRSRWPLFFIIICIFKSLAFNNRSKPPSLVHVWQETPRPADNTSIEYIVSLSQARTGGFKRFLDSFAPKKTVCSSARGLNLLTFNGYVVPCSRGTYAGIKR